MLERKATPYIDRRWPGVRRRVLARDMGVCQVRGPRCRGTATHCDHIIPWSQGGAWFDEANLRAACVSCNCGRWRAVEVDRDTIPTPSRVW